MAERTRKLKLLSGGWASLATTVEDRALPALDTQPAYPSLAASGVWNTNWDPPQLNVNTGNALTVSDAYACVRVLADSISSLPLHVYRKTEQGRVRAGENSRAVQLLNRPSPGTTGVDLVSQLMVHLNVYGEAFIGKYRAADGEIAQLVLIGPDLIGVELRGQRIVYVLDSQKGRTEHGPEDILHVKGMSSDGLRGMSPVTQCRVALGLSSSLQQSAKVFFQQGSRPSGILTAADANPEQLQMVAEGWRIKHSGIDHMHRVAVLSGDVKFTPVSFNADDSQFL